jgi:hypothetical protein
VGAGINQATSRIRPAGRLLAIAVLEHVALTCYLCWYLWDGFKMVYVITADICEELETWYEERTVFILHISDSQNTERVLKNLYTKQVFT